jgi:hypothetical protein
MILFDRPQDRSPNHGGPITPLYVVLHATASEFDSAYGWLRNGNVGPNRVSAHYIADRIGRVFCLVPEGLEAWHAGISKWEGYAYLNRHSIGIEMVNLNNGRDPYPAAQYLAVLELVTGICRRWSIPATRNRIVAHYDISPGRKTDPAGFPMEKFVADVYATLSGGQLPPPPPPPEAQQYIVTPSNGVKIRQAPNTAAQTVAMLPRGERVRVGKVLTKADKADCEEVVEGDSRWAWLADGRGFVYFRYLTKVG